MGRMIGRRRVPLVIAVMVVARSASAVRSASQATPAPAPCAPEQRIGEQRFVPTGGVDHWITITNGNCANPVDLPALGSEFTLPVYIVQGAEDLVAVPEVAQRYFDSIAAPGKRFMVVRRTGRDPNRAILAAVHARITRAARLIQ